MLLTANTNAYARNLFRASTILVILLTAMLFMAMPVSATSSTASNRTSLYSNGIIISLEADSFTYTGEEICPAITITYNGHTVSSNNYKVVYTKNVDIGTAIVKVTGKNKFRDIRYFSFEIVEDKGQSIANYASTDEFVGLNYVYGGTDKSGFDCSGFVQYVYRQFGIALPRTADSQMNVGTKINSISELAPGDIVVFYGGGHVGIYIGNGQFVHAANSEKGLIISSFYGDADTYDHYGQSFTSGARVI